MVAGHQGGTVDTALSGIGEHHAPHIFLFGVATLGCKAFFSFPRENVVVETIFP